METRNSRGLFFAYVAVAIVTALMMFSAAVDKLTFEPGKVGGLIDRFVDLPMGWLRGLGVYEAVCGVGLLIGMLQPKVGIAAGIGLVLYFAGYYYASTFAPGPLSDWLDLAPSLRPFMLSIAAVVLRFVSTRRLDVHQLIPSNERE